MSTFSLQHQLKTTYVNGFYLRSSLGYTGSWVAWCKREPFTGEDPFDESGDVWFEFGPTRERAIENLRHSMEAETAKIAGEDSVRKTVDRAMAQHDSHQ